MLLIESYLAGCGIIGTGLIIMRHRKRQIQRQHAQWLLMLIKNLRQLLEMLPKHRGMANALLKGDNTFRKPLTELQTSIDKQLKSLAIYMQDGQSPCAKATLKLIQKHWAKIQGSLSSMQAADSFKIHTQLIATIMECLDDAGLSLAQCTDSENTGLKLLNVISRELPHALESMGQARGIGTGVAAQGKSTAANRINLKFLHGKITAIVNQQLVPMAKVLSKHLHSRQPIKTLDAAVQSAQAFLNSLSVDLIQADQPAIKPEVYYQHGTKAIDAGFTLFDILLAQWCDASGLQYKT